MLAPRRLPLIPMPVKQAGITAGLNFAGLLFIELGFDTVSSVPSD